ncbi:MAG TPA: Vms1/Ankzf1 family peptidyl-tRNA hydrolase [Thermoleophilaceae bacterium]|nr:Vms1/Ankzf1 family peptidyl-tRNA hydrolase [Thermoleophilaceae bacterium]
MQVTAPDRGELRRLAEVQLDRPVVLSLYLDLDPAQFATPPARATAVRSLLDEAERRLRERDGLPHQDRADLNASLKRAATLLERDLPTDGAQAVAVFASNGAGLFEVLALPRPVPSRVAIGRSPLVGPLARLERRERWCVCLVSRRDARIFRGSPESLREIEQIHDVVFGQHDQGGWSQARYQRGIEKEKDDHLKHTAEALMKHFKRGPFQRLILGGPREVVADFESKLHGYLSERLAGRIEVDVDSATSERVLKKAQPLFEELEEEREAAALERLGEGSRAAVGLDEVLQALNERRVECLLLDERFAAPGTTCPECGWLGPGGERTCPVDGGELEQLEDLTEAAIELTLQQSAEILAVRRRREELEERAGGVAALLRF